jgi:uncharacterized protein YbjT (DUF2867 family)
MSSIKTVAVAGAAGALGSVLVKELIQSGFSVTALTRSDSNVFPPEVKIQKVDYNDLKALTQALKGQDAVVSTITTAGIGSQKNLVDAVVAAGVKRFIPSEYGCDLSNAKARQLPVYGHKVQIEDAVEQKIKNTDTTYTFVFNNAFLDWGIDRGFLIDLKNKKADIYDGGDVPFTSTPIPMVAKAVAAVLQHPEETKNAEIRVHGARLTQNKFLELAKRVVGEDGWQISETTTKDLEQQSYENLKKDPSAFMGWAIGMLKVAIHAPGFGGDFSSNNDNKFLGLKEMSESEVEELIRDRAQAQ